MGENLFKFIFGNIEDRDQVYKNQPLSLDGAHLILKPWPEDKVLNDIPFNVTTIWMQIHGLPPAMVREGTAERIGNRVGVVIKETINKRCVVAHSYL